MDYRTDRAEWLKEQIALLRSGTCNKLDMENLADELTFISCQKSEIFNDNPVVLFRMLLKYMLHTTSYQSGYRSIDDVTNIRNALNKKISETPEIKDKLNERLISEYRIARQSGIIQQYAIPVGGKCPPEECPWTFDEILDDSYHPTQIYDANDRHTYYLNTQ